MLFRKSYTIKVNDRGAVCTSNLLYMAWHSNRRKDRPPKYRLPAKRYRCWAAAEYVADCHFFKVESYRVMNKSMRRSMSHAFLLVNP